MLVLIRVTMLDRGIFKEFCALGATGNCKDFAGSAALAGVCCFPVLQLLLLLLLLLPSSYSSSLLLLLLCCRCCCRHYGVHRRRNVSESGTA